MPEGAVVLVDSAPIIYVLEGHRTFAQRFVPLFERQAAGEIYFAVTTIAIAEILVGPLSNGHEALARRYRAIVESWQVVPLTIDIAESAASMRARMKLKLADAIQVASAVAIQAAALVTHDRDFAAVKGISILS
ncbi:MAG: PIN domain-containing protein [Burkholderiaceae bacterium]